MVVAISVDMLAAGWLWRTYDITISSMCGLELRNPYPAAWARWLGGLLNALQRNHCEKAIHGDMERARKAIARLGGVIN
jgi:hypothetical protein